MEIFHNDWADLLRDEMAKPYYRELRQFLIFHAIDPPQSAEIFILSAICLNNRSYYV